MMFLVDECTGPAVAHCFRERRPHHGVVFLRLANERSANKIRVLDQLISLHGDAIADHFVVVTETRVRFAKA